MSFVINFKRVAWSSLSVLVQTHTPERLEDRFERDGLELVVGHEHVVLELVIIVVNGGEIRGSPRSFELMTLKLHVVKN